MGRQNRSRTGERQLVESLLGWAFGGAMRPIECPAKKEGTVPGIWLKSLRILALAGLALAASPALSQDEGEEPEGPAFPTTEFAEGAKGATVTDGDITASISMVRRKDLDPDFDVPMLSVEVGGIKVLESAG